MKINREFIKSEYSLELTKGENENKQTINIEGLGKKEAINTGTAMIKAGYDVKIKEITEKIVTFVIDKPADNKPADNKPADNKPADNKPADNKKK